MHQTTVRFAPDLWAQLEREAERAGVSAAQYVREATLARLCYSAGRRGDGPFGAPPRPAGATAGAGSRADSRARSNSNAPWAR